MATSSPSLRRCSGAGVLVIDRDGGGAEGRVGELALVHERADEVGHATLAAELNPCAAGRESRFQRAE